MATFNTTCSLSILRGAALGSCLVMFSMLLTSQPAWGQDEEKEDAPVTIEREPLMVKSPDAYQFRFHLAPTRRVEVRASTSGSIKQVNVKPGDTVRSQFKLAALDDTRQQLNLKIAAAKLEVAKQLKPSDSEPAAAISAKQDLANAEVELAKYELALTDVLAPFDGKVDELLQREGVFVTPGTVIAVLIDDSELTVQLPLERANMKQGDTISIQVESKQVSAKVQNISGLPAELDSLRDLGASVAMVTCVVDNTGKQYHAGQTVYSPLIPRHAVAEVDLDAVINSPQGGRQVQVIREQTVRNIRVQALGQLGDDRIFVSGLFVDGDEVVNNSSVELKEGTLVQSVFDSEDARKGKGRTSSQNPSNSRGAEF
ncbi:MAG: hypothetical protein CMJ46_04430 [Planctomyces sp.]|nr:hypothetical protein [Planctomyces sp.]